MANYANLKAQLDANIYQNDLSAITGAIMNTQLKAMVDALGAGYQFMGLATPTTNPGTPDQRVFYIVAQPGTYTNFLNAESNPLIVNNGEVAILRFDTYWSKLTTGIAPALVGYQYMGIATPSTDPGTPDQKVFYLASQAGTYTNFPDSSANALVVNDGEVCALVYSTSWSKQVTGAATSEKVEQLGQELIVQDQISVPKNEHYYYQTIGLSVGSSFSGQPVSTSDDVVCGFIDCSEGDLIKVSGNGNAYAYKTYFIVNTSNVVTRITTSSRTDETITIQSGEKRLYFNLLNYDSQTDGVWKIVNESLKDAIVELQENGFEVTSIKEKRDVTENYAYNIGSISVGSIFSASRVSADGYAYMWIPFFGGKIKIFGKGNPYAYRGYMFLDKNQKVLAIAQSAYDSRGVGMELTPPSETTRILVQFFSYESSIDYVEVETSYNSQDVYRLARLPYDGKTIVCFGDSLTEFADRSRGMGYADYVGYLSGANVINCGIGGAQLRQRTTPVSSPTTADEAYAALDIVSMIHAACAGDFSKQTAAATWLKNNTGDDNTEIVTRLASIDWQKVDAVIVFGGTNDWNNAPNNWGNIDDNDEGTTFGAINYIINLLSATYKSVQLVWITPIVRWLNYAGGSGTADNFSDNAKKNDKTLREFSEIVSGIVKNLHIPVYDAYNKLGWNMNNFSQFFEDNDGTHPYKGFQILGEKIYSFLRENLAIAL